MSKDTRPLPHCNRHSDYTVVCYDCLKALETGWAELEKQNAEYAKAVDELNTLKQLLEGFDVARMLQKPRTALSFTPLQQAEREHFVKLLREDLGCAEDESVRGGIRRLKERIAANQHYRSTACHHEQHGNCRFQCKFCAEQCSCECHSKIERETKSIRTYQELVEQNAALLAENEYLKSGNAAKSEQIDRDTVAIKEIRQANDARTRQLEAELAKATAAANQELSGCELHGAMLDVFNHQNLEWTEEYAKLELKIEKLESRLVDRGRTLDTLEAELAKSKHAFNMLQHDVTESNRVHNAEMNRMSEELRGAQARVDFLEELRDAKTATIVAKDREIARLTAELSEVNRLREHYEAQARQDAERDLREIARLREALPTIQRDEDGGTVWLCVPHAQINLTALSPSTSKYFLKWAEKAEAALKTDKC